MYTPKPLYQRTLLAILISGVLFLVVLYVPRMILYGAGVIEPLPILVTMALNLLLWFVIVPFWLRLPNGREPFQVYLTSIGLKSRFPFLCKLEDSGSTCSFWRQHVNP